jgi:hypothetical protein
MTNNYMPLWSLISSLNSLGHDKDKVMGLLIKENIMDAESKEPTGFALNNNYAMDYDCWSSDHINYFWNLAKIAELMYKESM